MAKDRVKRLALIMAALVSLTGCSLLEADPDPFPLTKEVLLGTWACKERPSTIEFTESGFVRAENIGHLLKAMKANDMVDGGGSYQLPNTAGTNKVELVFTQLSVDGKVNSGRFTTDLTAFSLEKEIWLQSEGCHYLK